MYGMTNEQELLWIEAFSHTMDMSEACERLNVERGEWLAAKIIERDTPFKERWGDLAVELWGDLLDDDEEEEIKEPETWQEKEAARRVVADDLRNELRIYLCDKFVEVHGLNAVRAIFETGVSISISGWKMANTDFEHSARRNCK